MRTTSAARVLRVAKTIRLNPMQARKIEYYTRKFKSIQRIYSQEQVRACVLLGAILENARRDLSGIYSRWVADRLGLDRSTAGLYRSLSAFACEQPQVLGKWKALGPSKLYCLSRVPPLARNKLLSTSNLESLSNAEFRRLAQPYFKRRRPVSTPLRMARIRDSARFLAQRLRALPLQDVALPLQGSLKAVLLRLKRAVQAVLGAL